MSRRSRAREIALQLLYQDDLGGPSPTEVEAAFIAGRLAGHAPSIDFARQVLTGVRAHRDEIDAQLQAVSSRWNLGRMAVVDRNILRLGAYEIVYTAMPKAVAINEAILLAKRYGSQQSHQFVNGVLDQLSPPAPGGDPAGGVPSPAGESLLE